MPDVPKVEAPLDEIAVSYRYNRDGKGERKPYLVVSLDCLHEIFCNENAIVAEEDVERLVACLCHYARRTGTGDVPLAAEMAAKYDNMVESEDDDPVNDWSHTYSVTKCPKCNHDLTAEDDGVLLEFYIVGAGNNFVASRLTEAGELVDVDDLIANGKHSDTLCGECHATLNDHEVL